MIKWKLRLYVMGNTPRSEAAIANLYKICQSVMNGKYELSIIDVLEQPELAENERIIATPTLIKELPLPIRRVIGDLSAKEKVLMGLNIEPETDEENKDNH